MAEWRLFLHSKDTVSENISATTKPIPNFAISCFILFIFLYAKIITIFVPKQLNSASEQHSGCDGVDVDRREKSRIL